MQINGKEVVLKRLPLVAQRKGITLAGRVGNANDFLMFKSTDAEIDKALADLLEAWKEFCELAVENPDPSFWDGDVISNEQIGEVLKSFFTRVLTMNAYDLSQSLSGSSATPN